MTNRTSRLAPSTTGALHLGNIRTFLINWALARNEGWTLVMRLEDLDGPRNKPDAAAATLDCLTWLGMDWDGTEITQSVDLAPYRAALDQLAASGQAYSCSLSRKDIKLAASAPHVDEHEVCFPRSLRPDGPERYTVDNLETNYRFVVPESKIEINDAFTGLSRHDPAAEVGDFVIWTKRGVPAYQLAVVVDDHRQGVTDVVRGDDLLTSAARQHLLYDALGLPEPRWWHLPLVLGPDGHRLAKRHGDTRALTFRDLQVRAERIIGLIGSWCIPGFKRTEMTATEFRNLLQLDTLPRSPITFTAEDHAWLIQPPSPTPRPHVSA